MLRLWCLTWGGVAAARSRGASRTSFRAVMSSERQEPQQSEDFPRARRKDEGLDAEAKTWFSTDS